MATTASKISRKTAVQTILQRAVLLKLSRHYLGNHRAIRFGEVVEEAGGDLNGSSADMENMFHAFKRLIDPKETLPVRRIQRQFRIYLEKITIPMANVFGQTTYLIPLMKAEECEEMLLDLEKRLHEEAVLLSQRYTQAVENQHRAMIEAGLGSQFDPDDYVKPEDVINAFSVEWSYKSFDAPDRLQSVSSALFKKAQEKAEHDMSNAFAEVRLVLRVTLQQIVATIAKKLRPGSDGETKSFRGSILDQLAEFLSTFSFRNLTDDGELEKVAAKLKKLSAGIDIEQLKKADDVRVETLKQVESIETQLGALVQTHKRLLSFDGLS